MFLSSCRVLVAWSGEGQVVPPATACGVRTLVLGRGDLKETQIKSSEALCKSKGNSFGFTRIIWGSDSPVCNLGGGVETWVAATYLMTQDWSNEEKKNFFWSNAINLWDLN